MFCVVFMISDAFYRCKHLKWKVIKCTLENKENGASLTILGAGINSPLFPNSADSVPAPGVSSSPYLKGDEQWVKNAKNKCKKAT